MIFVVIQWKQVILKYIYDYWLLRIAKCPYPTLNRTIYCINDDIDKKFRHFLDFQISNYPTILRGKSQLNIDDFLHLKKYL